MKAHTDYAATLTLLALLICGDLAFMLIHVLHVWTPWLSGSHYSIETDRGLAENYQYIKQLWIVACMAVAFVQTRSKIFAGWMVLFTFLLLDDAAEIHEHVGFWLGARFDLPAIAGLRPDDFGELSFAAFVGSLTVCMVAFTLWRGDARARQVSRDILCLIGALAFFGVGVDLIHVMAYFNAPAISRALTLIEDGGEMLVISLLTCYAFDIVSHSGALRIDVYGMLKTIWHGTASRPAHPAAARRLG